MITSLLHWTLKTNLHKYCNLPDDHQTQVAKFGIHVAILGALFLFSFCGDLKRLQLGTLATSQMNYLGISNVIGSVLCHVQIVPFCSLFPLFIPFLWPQKYSFRQLYLNFGPLKECWAWSPKLMNRTVTTDFKVRGSQKFQLVGTNGIINHTTT